MKRYEDIGCRIIKYRNYPRMFLGIGGLVVALTGLWSLLSGRGTLWPVFALGIYWTFIALQYPNINIYYSSQRMILWWGPFFPVKKRTKTFKEIQGLQVEKTFSHNLFVSVKQEEWDLSVIFSGEKKLFLITFPTRELAEEFASKLASDLMSKVQIKEDPKTKVSPVPAVRNPLQRMKDRLGRDKRHI